MKMERYLRMISSDFTRRQTAQQQRESVCVLVGNVHVAVSSLCAVLLDCAAAATECVLIHLVLDLLPRVDEENRRVWVAAAHL